MADSKQLLVRLTAENHEGLRKASFCDRRSMTDLVNEAVQEWLQKREVGK